MITIIFLLVDCPPNYHQFVSESTTTCVPCERGTYSNDDGQVTCISCPEHMSTLNIGASDIEDCIGRYNITECLHTIYVDLLYSLSLTDQCPPGYNSTTGLIPCEPCAEYYYQLDYGATTCTQCTERDAFNITKCAPEPAGINRTIIIILHSSIVISSCCNYCHIY